jgi:hypothetical protein
MMEMATSELRPPRRPGIRGSTTALSIHPCYSGNTLCRRLEIDLLIGIHLHMYVCMYSKPYRHAIQSAVVPAPLTNCTNPMCFFRPLKYRQQRTNQESMAQLLIVP